MAERPRNILICSCEDTMPLDGEKVRRVCRDSVVIEGRQFCRAELDRVRKAAAGGEPIVIACTQEAPLFNEIAEAIGADAPTFVNIRETGGWAKDAAKAGPKMAALIAATASPAPDVSFVPLSSDGVTLLYGKDERVIEAAELLKEHLDVTVLIKAGSELTPRRVTEFPVVRGVIRAAYNMHDFITDRHLNNMAKVMLATGLIVGYGYMTEAFFGWYSANQYEAFMIKNRAFGPYAPTYWALIFCNIMTPQLLWFKKVRANVPLLFVISLVVNVGMWLERFVIVITSLHRDFVPSSWGLYHPTAWDWATYLGTIGLFVSLMFLFIRVLPMISIFEVRTLLPQAKVKH